MNLAVAALDDGRIGKLAAHFIFQHQSDLPIATVGRERYAERTASLADRIEYQKLPSIRESNSIDP
jgi:hypothetical protein